MAATNNNNQEQKLPQLGNSKDWNISADDHRVFLTCASSSDDDGATENSWTFLSSAVLNGGLQQTCCTTSKGLQVINVKVPLDYDGVNPNPVQFLEDLAAEQGNSAATTNTIGMMTAASMKSLRIASQQATLKSMSPTTATQGRKQQVFVDAIVTAGISNSRAAGADADCFMFASPSEEYIATNSSANVKEALNATNMPAPIPATIPPGTINTIIVTNAILDDQTLSTSPVSALVEAYAIAIEAKCRASAELGVMCAKRPDQLAQGTGTDSTMFICRRNNASKQQTNASGTTTSSSNIPRVQFAGKHTLFGELVGQAVYQATHEAIMANFEYLYGSNGARKYWSMLPLPIVWIHHLHCYKLQFVHALYQGHRPWVPSQPMKPVPKPQGVLLMVGIMGVLLTFWMHVQFGSFVVDKHSLGSATTTDNATSLVVQVQQASQYYLRPSITVLLAVLSWDRFLGGSLFVPIALHPVCLVGTLINTILKLMPESAFQDQHHVQGLIAGCLLFLGTVMASLTVAWGVLVFPWTALLATHDGASTSSGLVLLSKFLPWFFELYLVQSAMNLQLLCSIALQMAHFLERGQLDEARAQLSWLCSRDPSNLLPDELAGGTLESLAENLSDSLVSPLVWYVLLGPLGAFGFRVINTLDSCVGYRGKYEYVGKPSARVDDLLNLFSARLTALLLALAARCLTPTPKSGASMLYKEKDKAKKNSICATRGLQAAWRDAGQCDSPNAGWPMGAMAGILNVCLEKKGQYALNKVGVPPGYASIRRGHKIAELAGFLSVLLALAVSFVLGVGGGTSYRW